jgi:hypothetical protein
VMSTDGERGRVGSSWGLGVRESSGAGGGGSTKWNVRDAIWICELPMCKWCTTHVWIGEKLPLAQGNFPSFTTPRPVDPGTVPA